MLRYTEEYGRRDTAMLDLIEVSKTFEPGTVNEKKALDRLSLHVDKGDFITIVGSNGAGKTTLFNAIAGNFLADRGRIVLNGQDITFLPVHQRSRQIGRLFQDPLKGTAPHMTIEENLALAYRRAGGKTSLFSRISSQDRRQFREALKELDMGLENRLTTPVGTLSGGQRQALTLLMATIVPPALLLLDEHTAALDPGAAEKIMALTEQIVSRDKVTCLMITHNLQQAVSIGNRTLMMENGRIILDISGEEHSRLTAEDLIRRFRETAGRSFDNDRILLSD